ncbi:MAG: hypothetical protein AAF439_11240 [Pseudomonadota bacterium]
METVLPNDIAGALADAQKSRARRRSKYRVRHGDREHPVIELTTDGFVIEADGRPPLRGYADIYLADERILRSLVICTWARDGLVGYEFKHDSLAGNIRADHAPPTHAGLLTADG